MIINIIFSFSALGLFVLSGLKMLEAARLQNIYFLLSWAFLMLSCAIIFAIIAKDLGR